MCQHKIKNEEVFLSSSIFTFLFADFLFAYLYILIYLCFYYGCNKYFFGSASEDNGTAAKDGKRGRQGCIHLGRFGCLVGYLNLEGGDKEKMSMNKILVALVIAFAVVGLTGVASASIFDDYLYSSYAHTSIFYTSPTISVSEDYYGTHTSDFSASGITTQTDITIYESPSIFDSYDYGAYTSSPSISDSYDYGAYTSSPSISDSYDYGAYTSSPSIFDSYDYGAYTSSPSIFDSFWP